MLTTRRFGVGVVCAAIAMALVDSAAAVPTVAADQDYYSRGGSAAHLTAAELSSCQGQVVEIGLYPEPVGASAKPDLKVAVTVSAEGSAAADVEIGLAIGYHRAAVVAACLPGGRLLGNLVYVGPIIDTLPSVVTDRQAYAPGETVRVEAAGFVGCAGQQVQLGIFQEGNDPVLATATVDFVKYGATVSVIAESAGTAFPGVRGSCVAGTTRLGTNSIVIGAPSPPDAGNGAVNPVGDGSGWAAFGMGLLASGALLLAAATLQRRR